MIGTFFFLLAEDRAQKGITKKVTVTLFVGIAHDDHEKQLVERVRF